jgi:hypothetical protein
MDKMQAALLEKILEAVTDRCDAIEARAIATDLMVLSIIEASPHRDQILDRMEQKLDPAVCAQSPVPRIASKAQDQLRRRLQALRSGDQSPDLGSTPE